MADGSPSDLSFDDLVAWAAELHVEWDRVLKDAGVGTTQKYIVKSRWGSNPKQMADIVAELDRREAKRVSRTTIGAKREALEEWRRIGAVLSQDMGAFLEAIKEAKKSAAQVESAASMKPFLSVTPEPKRPRK